SVRRRVHRLPHGRLRLRERVPQREGYAQVAKCRLRKLPRPGEPARQEPQRRSVACRTESMEARRQTDRDRPFRQIPRPGQRRALGLGWIRQKMAADRTSNDERINKNHESRKHESRNRRKRQKEVHFLSFSSVSAFVFS